MKALSIHQPWAWAILHAGKAVENRSWPTRHRGPLLVHASRSRASYERETLADWPALYGVTLPSVESLAFGALVGTMTVTDCVRADPQRPAFVPGVGPDPWAEGPWLWLLAEPVAFAAPVAYRGAQQLFEVPEL